MMSTDDLQPLNDQEAEIKAIDAEAKAELGNVHVLKNEELSAYIPADLLARYEFYSFRHAAEILSTSCKPEFDELLNALRAFEITVADIVKPGGNESDIPKKLTAILRPLGWQETRVQGDLIVRKIVRHGQRKDDVTEDLTTLANFIDGHNVDYVKNRVAFDMEWNSKDQTFDRDLYAFSAFAQTGVISAGVLLTRSADLNPVFTSLGNDAKGKPIRNKYGASTTWMGKLLYRLEAGRNGPCPVLAVGIRPAVISDLTEHLASMPARGAAPAPAPAEAPEGEKA